MEFDERVRRVYERVDEDERLWRAGPGELIRLRTWDIFGRLLPAGSRIAHLAAAGHDLLLLDAIRLTEDEPSMVGASGHVLGVAQSDLP